MTYPAAPVAGAPGSAPAGPGTPRPSRTVRWAVGGVTAGLLALVAVVAVAVALGRAVSGAGGDCVFPPGAPAMFCEDEYLTEEAMATVVRVDSLGGSDAGFPDGESPPPLPFDLPGWTVDLTYTTVSGEDVRARDIMWPTTGEEPVEGATVRVAYDPDDPEYSVTSASALAAARATPSAADGERRRPSPAGPLWTAGGTAAAAVVALLLTVLWARRAPRPARPTYAGYQPYQPYQAWGYPTYQQPYQQPYPPQPGQPVPPYGTQPYHLYAPQSGHTYPPGQPGPAPQPPAPQSHPSGQPQPSQPSQEPPAPPPGGWASPG